MTLYILANPKAGSQTAEQLIARIRRQYPNVTVHVYMTTVMDDEYKQLKSMIARFNTNQDKLLILGGDGTLSKALKALPATLPFAYYPTGSGNDFARSMGIEGLEQVMEALLTDRMQSITVLSSDLGIIVNSLDVGYAAQVIAYSADSRLKKWLNTIHLGKLTYLFFGIRSLFSRANLRITISMDGVEQVLEELFFLSIANNTYFGGGIMIWPEASAKSQQIDMVWFKRGNLFQRIRALVSLLLKQHHTSPLVHHETAQNVTLVAQEEVILQMDGEVHCAREVSLTCQERQIYL